MKFDLICFKIFSLFCLFVIASGCDNTPAEPNPNDRWLPEDYVIKSVEADNREVSIKLECMFKNKCFEFVKNETYKLGEDIYVNVYFRKTGSEYDSLACPPVTTKFITYPVIKVGSSGSFNFKFVKNSSFSVDTTFIVP